VIPCGLSLGEATLKIVEVRTLISKGAYATSGEWLTLKAQIASAVQGAVWPPGGSDFAIHPQSGKKSGEGNGVKPLKTETVQALTKGGLDYGKRTKLQQPPVIGEWVSEVPWPSEGGGPKAGNMDVAYYGTSGKVCLEWETGNISSSHRSLNKMCMGLMNGTIKAGVLVVPSKSLAQYLTDRVGNIGELEPYMKFWSSAAVAEGVLEIIVIEHDRTDVNVPKIPKGTDGRAKG